MKNERRMKGFGLGIIFLFLGTCVLPSISANAVNVDSTADITKNNSMMKIALIFIGSIKNSQDSGNHVYFECVRVFAMCFTDGTLTETTVFEGSYPFWCDYDTKIGFVGQHFICAIFRFTG